MVEVHQRDSAIIRELFDMVDCGRRLLTFCSVTKLWLYTYIRYEDFIWLNEMVEHTDVVNVDKYM